jgi:hypothetical protein
MHMGLVMVSAVRRIATFHKWQFRMFKKDICHPITLPESENETMLFEDRGSLFPQANMAKP